MEFAGRTAANKPAASSTVGHSTPWHVTLLQACRGWMMHLCAVMLGSQWLADPLLAPSLPPCLLHSKLLELLRQVAERAKRLNEQLTDAEVAAGSLVLRNQVTAASMVVATGFHATHELQCEAAEALRLCDALALILRAGPSCAEAAAPAGDTSSLQVQLNAVAQAADQLQQNSEAGAAFVRTVVRPEALLPWLAAAACALEAGWSRNSAGKPLLLCCCHAIVVVRVRVRLR